MSPHEQTCISPTVHFNLSPQNIMQIFTRYLLYQLYQITFKLQYPSLQSLSKPLQEQERYISSNLSRCFRNLPLHNKQTICSFFAKYFIRSTNY